MHKHNFYPTLFILLLSFCSFNVTAQVHEPSQNPDWLKPYPPFRIVGNLYYVGTYDLASYLISTDEGNILINTGLASSASLIKDNIEKLGFKFSDIKILLLTHAHFDHVGAMMEIKKQTGAKLMVDAKDAEVLADGGSSDYELGHYGKTFEPVKADRLLYNGDTIALGNMQLVMLHHPGHTKGSCSFLFTVKDSSRWYRVLIANMPSIIISRRFAAIVDYPGIANDYAYTLQALKQLHFDIWLSSHTSQFQLHAKHQPGDGYNPAAFIDQPGYDAELKDLQHDYDEKIKKDKKG